MPTGKDLPQIRRKFNSIKWKLLFESQKRQTSLADHPGQKSLLLEGKTIRID